MRPENSRWELETPQASVGAGESKVLYFAIEWTFQTGETIRTKVFMWLFCLSFAQSRRKISDIIVMYKDLLLSDGNPAAGSFLRGFCALFFLKPTASKTNL